MLAAPLCWSARPHRNPSPCTAPGVPGASSHTWWRGCEGVAASTWRRAPCSEEGMGCCGMSNAAGGGEVGARVPTCPHTALTTMPTTCRAQNTPQQLLRHVCGAQQRAVSGLQQLAGVWPRASRRCKLPVAGSQVRLKSGPAHAICGAGATPDGPDEDIVKLCVSRRAAGSCAMLKSMGHSTCAVCRAGQHSGKRAQIVPGQHDAQHDAQGCPPCKAHRGWHARG